MILVTGATGHFGKATINFLLQKGVQPAAIAVLVRDEAKASDINEKGVTLRVGDYDNTESLKKAFAGVDKLLFISGTDPGQRARQHANVVAAAIEAGVKHIVYTSFERKNETAASPIAFLSLTHLDTEKAIKESGMAYTILRNNLYADVLPMFLGDKVLDTGVYFPAGEAKAAFALRADMAEATANILTTEGHENKEYFLSNTEEVSLRDVAGVLTEVSGKEVAYYSPDTTTYTKALTDAGVPQQYASMFSAFGEAIHQGEFSGGPTDLEHLLGRKPGKVRDYLASVYAA